MANPEQDSTVVDALRAATLTKGRIAAQFGVSTSYVFNLKKRHGL